MPVLNAMRVLAEEPRIGLSFHETSRYEGNSSWVMVLTVGSVKISSTDDPEDWLNQNDWALRELDLAQTESQDVAANAQARSQELSAAYMALREAQDAA